MIESKDAPRVWVTLDPNGHPAQVNLSLDEAIRYIREWEAVAMDIDKEWMWNEDKWPEANITEQNEYRATVEVANSKYLIVNTILRG